MSSQDRTDAIAALLAEAERAHKIYESNELGGVYDEDWARWYAAYAVDHGIGGLVGRHVAADPLAGVLTRAFDEFKRAEPKPAESWADWTARRITAEP
jgi:hypothetical protein